MVTEESRLDVELNTKRDEQGSKVPDFFRRIDGLHHEMRWQNELRKRRSLYWFARHLGLWKRLAFASAVLSNLVIIATLPLTDERWHGWAWVINIFLVTLGKASMDDVRNKNRHH